MSLARVNGVNLYYEEHGAGAPPILCIHGTGSSALVWEDAVPALSRRGRVILYDRRGCTRSERPEGYDTVDVRDHTEDAAGLLRELNAAPAVIIGRSYGGEVALDLLQHHPDLVNALILLEPSVLALTPDAAAFEAMLLAQVRSVAAADGPAPAAERFLQLVLGDAHWAEVPAPIRRIFLANAPAILAELNGARFAPDAVALAHLPRPALVVSGETSPHAFRSADEQLVTMIPGARHEIVAGGHLINPAAQVVLDFLDVTLAGAAQKG